MPRKKKGTHTSPAKAGRQNMDGSKEGTDKNGIMAKIMPAYKHGNKLDFEYKGEWTDELLEDEIKQFFDYCLEVDVKPNNPLLTVWLGMSKSQYQDWIAKPEKYGRKSELIATARKMMESYLNSNVDSYPTGSIFLLKAYHGIQDTNHVDITSNGKSLGATPEEIAESINKLGLGK